jgi:hypothetical protein
MTRTPTPARPSAMARWVLPTPGGAEDQHILSGADEAPGRQLADESLIDRRLKLDSNSSRGLDGGKMCDLTPIARVLVVMNDEINGAREVMKTNDNLLPQEARFLLMLGSSQTTNHAVLHRIFREY